MSETWADAQFDMLEAAYDEVPIEAKARIAELERALEGRDGLIRDMLRDFEEQMHGPTIYPQTWYVAHKIRAQKLGIEVD